jgi:hypothetical protein
MTIVKRCEMQEDPVVQITALQGTVGVQCRSTYVYVHWRLKPGRHAKSTGRAIVGHGKPPIDLAAAQ